MSKKEINSKEQGADPYYPVEENRPNPNILALHLYLIGHACGRLKTSPHSLRQQQSPTAPTRQPPQGSARSQSQRHGKHTGCPSNNPMDLLQHITGIVRDIQESVAVVRTHLIQNSPADEAAKQCLRHIEEFNRTPKGKPGQALRHAGEGMRVARHLGGRRDLDIPIGWAGLGELIAKAEICSTVSDAAMWDQKIRDRLTGIGLPSLITSGSTRAKTWDRSVRAWLVRNSTAGVKAVYRIAKDFRSISIGRCQVNLSRAPKKRVFLDFLHNYLRSQNRSEFDVNATVEMFNSNNTSCEISYTRFKQDFFRRKSTEFNLLFERVSTPNSETIDPGHGEPQWYRWKVPLDTSIG